MLVGGFHAKILEILTVSKNFQESFLRKNLNFKGNFFNSGTVSKKLKEALGSQKLVFRVKNIGNYKGDTFGLLGNALDVEGKSC